MKFLKFNTFNNKYLINEYENTLEIFDKYRNVDNVFDKDKEKNEEIVLRLLNFLKYKYSKNSLRKRKILNSSKKNVSKNNNKNSLRRDSNVNLLGLFLKEVTKNGLKCRYNKHFNIFLENFFFVVDENNKDFIKYDNYEFFNFFIKKNKSYNNFNFILNLIIPNYDCMFDIKTKKNPKHLKTDEKYSHEIVYVPRNRRIKKSLKSMSLFVNNYKNYFLWERFFWLFVSVVLNSKKSFLIKKRQFIYKKALKLFKKKK